MHGLPAGMICEAVSQGSALEKFRQGRLDPRTESDQTEQGDEE